jgi:prevent-host-death family protein
MAPKDAKAAKWLDEVLDRIAADGPQVIDVSGRGKVVILQERDYRLLSERKPTFKEFLLNMPSLEGLDLTRDQTPARDIEI